jgi:hypothetical protein
MLLTLRGICLGVLLLIGARWAVARFWAWYRAFPSTLPSELGRRSY